MADNINLDDLQEAGKLLELFRKIRSENAKLTDEQKKAIADMAISHQEVFNQLGAIIKNEKEFKKLADDILRLVLDTSDSYELQKSITSDILINVREHIDILSKISPLQIKSLKNSVSLTRIERDALDDLNKKREANFSTITKSTTIARHALSILEDDLNKLTSLEDVLYFKKDSAVKELQEFVKVAGFPELAAAAAKGFEYIESEVKTRKDLYKIARRQLSQQVFYNDLLDSASMKVETFYGKYSSIAALIPGIGTALYNLIEEAKDDTVRALQTAAEEYKKTNNITQSIRAGLKNLTSNISKGTIAAGALGLAFAFVLKIMNSVYDTVYEISQGTGLAVSQSYDLFKNALRAQTIYDNQLSSVEDILGVQKGITQEFGRFVNTDAGVINQISDTAKTLGYTTEMAGSLQSVLNQLGADDNLAGNMQVAYGEMAKAYKIAPGLIPKDIVDNANFVATAFAGMPQKAMKTAIEIRKLGYNLAQAEKTLNHLFDIQGSLTSQMEASVGLGRALDFSAARQLAINGDILGMMKSISDQVGSYSDLMSMSIPQRMLLANATGLEVSELQRSMYIQEKLGHLSDEELKKAEKALRTVEGLEAMDNERLQAELSRAQSAERFNNAIGKLKNQLIVALLPLVETLATTFELIVPVINIMGRALRGALFPLEFIGKVLQGDLSGIKQSISDIFFDFKGIGSSIGSVVAMLGAAIGAKTILGGLLSFGSIGKASLQTFGSTLKTILSPQTYGNFFKTITSKLGNLGETIRGKLYKGGQFTPGGGRAPAGGTRVGGLLGRSNRNPTQNLPQPSTGGAGSSLINTISKIDTKRLLQGAAAMVVASGAIYIFARGIQQLEKVKDFKSVSLGLLGFVTTMGISTAILSAFAPVLYPAAAALIAFGAGVALFGVGVKQASEGISSLLDSLSIDKILNIYKLGPALLSASTGLMAFSSSLLSTSIAGGITAIFGNNILRSIKTLIDQIDPLEDVASTLKSISESLNSIQSFSMPKIESVELPKVQTPKIESVEPPKIPKILQQNSNQQDTSNNNVTNPTQNTSTSFQNNSNNRIEYLLNRLVMLTETSISTNDRVYFMFDDGTIREIQTRLKRQ